ncbi:MAG: AAA family ATPase [Nitrospirota bacterium]|nr:AAA family ATPase [Nitrospirota bacterium]
MKKFRIYIGGVGGVGKTVIGQELAHRNKMEHFSGSWIMMKLCNTNSREGLSEMPTTKKELIEKVSYPNFVIKKRRIIVDGHCGLLLEQVKCFDKFIFLTAPAEIIKYRRKQREEQRRNVDTQTILREQKEYELKISKIEQEHGVEFIRFANIANINKTCELIEKILNFKD